MIVVDRLLGGILWNGPEMRNSHVFFLVASGALPKDACAWDVSTVCCLLRNIIERTGFLWADGWLWVLMG